MQACILQKKENGKRRKDEQQQSQPKKPKENKKVRSHSLYHVATILWPLLEASKLLSYVPKFNGLDNLLGIPLTIPWGE
jgi:hypothetical protein